MPYAGERRSAEKGEKTARILFLVSGILLVIVAILAAIGVGLPQWVRLEPLVEEPVGERSINVGLFDIAFERQRPFPACKSTIMIGDIGCYITPWEVRYGTPPVGVWANVPVKDCWAQCQDAELQVIATVEASEWLQAIVEGGESGVVDENDRHFPDSCADFLTPRALIITGLVVAFVAACVAFAAAKAFKAGIVALVLALCAMVLLLIGFILAAVRSRSPCRDFDRLWEASWGASFALVLIAVILLLIAHCTLLMGLLAASRARREAPAERPVPVAVVRRAEVPHAEAYPYPAPVTAPQMHV